MMASGGRFGPPRRRTWRRVALDEIAAAFRQGRSCAAGARVVSAGLDRTGHLGDGAVAAGAACGGRGGAADRGAVAGL
ncbi:MAG: hypothetical protein MZV49_08035 [Rhodopseudomonas palustris]|nr:hypothetical protein [Rhodopseudomonas palustris]